MNVKHIVATVFTTLFCLATSAQELNCKVQVITPKLQQTDPKVFKTLEQSMTEFMNNRKWSNNKFKTEERIECSILLTITEERGDDTYKANMAVQSSRPVYNTSMNSVMLNWNDKDIVFRYREYEPIEFSENQYTTNLSSILSFYAFTIVGLDFESFSNKGGDPYFLKAKQVIETIPSTVGVNDAPGWRPFEGMRNRYWLNENLLNNRMETLRRGLYTYHFRGLDKMYSDKITARTQVLDALKGVDKANSELPNSMLVQVFTTAKSNELINIFSDSPQQEKSLAVEILTRIDPQNADKYFNMMKRSSQQFPDAGNNFSVPNKQ